MFCSRCGQRIAENTAFCPSCGTPTGVASGQQPVVQIVQPRSSFMETKSMDISPDMESYLIEEMEDFGWQVQNSQRVYAQDSHTGNITDFGNYARIETIIETTDFIKITFGRDKAMQHYAELKRLNDEYDKLEPVEIFDLPQRDWKFWNGVLFWPTAIRTIRQFNKKVEEIERLNEPRYAENDRRREERERLRTLAREIPKF